MEVHHPHHPTHKKKWSEYIIEFVMLFAAVTLGFFAENVREKLAEEKRSKELLEVVAKDFKSDIIKLIELKKDYVLKNKQCDTLLEYINLPASKIPEKKYYTQLLNYGIFWFFNSNEKSRNEAESKGLLFKNENVKLAEYVSKFNFYLKDYKEEDNMMLGQSKILFYELIPYITDPNIYPNKALKDKLLPNKIGLQKIDEKAILRLKYLIDNTKEIISFYNLDIDSLIYYAKKSITEIEN